MSLKNTGHSFSSGIYTTWQHNAFEIAKHSSSTGKTWARLVMDSPRKSITVRQHRPCSWGARGGHRRQQGPSSQGMAIFHQKEWKINWSMTL